MRLPSSEDSPDFLRPPSGEHAQKTAGDLELITVALLLTLALGRLDADFLVVLLQSRQILASLRELALLHTLTDVPVHERALSVHQVELVVNAAHDLRDGGAVRDHAHRTHDLRQVTARH